jgi:Tfp pilus assembly protein PilX
MVPGDEPKGSQRGSALFLALMLILVMSTMGFGLLSRTLLVERIAGSERWATKAFYAADAGIEMAKARLKVNNTNTFDFTLNDLRNGNVASQIDINVSALDQAGPPVFALGNQAGGSDGLYMFFYKGTSNSEETQLTNSARQVTAIFNRGPVPIE